jgi:hypothetical protein
MREINFLASDTAFILCLSIPEYLDDEATFLKNTNQSPTKDNIEKSALEKITTSFFSK